MLPNIACDFYRFIFSRLARLPFGLVLLIFSALLVAMPSGSADETADSQGFAETKVVCLQPSFWEVSSRCLPKCPAQGSELANFGVTKCIDGLWQTTHIEDLIQYCKSRPNHQLVIYVHGNWMEADNARGRGLAIYRAVQRYATRDLTFVSYTWPSERRQGFAKDVWAKRDRIDADSYYLANLVNQLDCSNPPGMIGFSFGGRVLVGSLHLLAGGHLAGRQLDTPSSNCYHLSLLAPAFDRTALAPCGEYDKALLATEQVVNLYNSRDPVLRRFRFFDSNRPTAAGFAGLVASTLTVERMVTSADRPLAANSKIIQYDCQSIGRSHTELDYFKCSAISQAINNVLAQ